MSGLRGPHKAHSCNSQEAHCVYWGNAGPHQECDDLQWKIYDDKMAWHPLERIGDAISEAGIISKVILVPKAVQFECNLDDIIKWKHLPRYWPFVREIHRSPVDPLTKASDAKLWRFIWFGPKQMVEQTMKTSVIWDAIALIMTSL